MHYPCLITSLHLVICKFYHSHSLVVRLLIIFCFMTSKVRVLAIKWFLIDLIRTNLSSLFDHWKIFIVCWFSLPMLFSPSFQAKICAPLALMLHQSFSYFISSLFRSTSWLFSNRSRIFEYLLPYLPWTICFISFSSSIIFSSYTVPTSTRSPEFYYLSLLSFGRIVNCLKQICLVNFGVEHSASYCLCAIM